MSVDIRDIVEKEEQAQLRSIPAQRLGEKLSLLKNRREMACKRWFWELLQNASDYNEKVSVRLTIEKDSVIFQHNGAPFSIRDVLNIISPDSNKTEDEIHTDNIGKFGTGLVSTHILSAQMTVEGLCEKDGNIYHFSVVLDRSPFVVKSNLIEQMSLAKDGFKESLEITSYSPGYNTSFSYKLGAPLPNLPAIGAEDIDLNYLYHILPYTLCFMPKVESVTICDNRNKPSEYSISRYNDGCENSIVFIASINGNKHYEHFAYFQYNNVSSVFKYQDDEIVPFPEDMPRLFCGLPLVGTEGIGIPFILNSLKFQPTTEREGVELEPGSNEENRALFADSTKLFEMVLGFVEEKKHKNAFVLTNLRRKYNGTQASNTQFINLYVPKYKQAILSHQIVTSMEDEQITFSQLLLPFNDSKADEALLNNASFLIPTLLPLTKDYQEWFSATDFTIFTDQKYTYDSMVKLIESYETVYGFGKEREEVESWLVECLNYLKQCDPYLFSRYKLLPNQEGTLCSSIDLKVDQELPSDLKDIHNDIFIEKSKRIGEKLLEKRFEELGVVNQALTIEDLCRKIDGKLAEVYSNNLGDTKQISGPLNKLYNWIRNSEIKKEDLSNWFHWYYPKMATLIVDMLNDVQREQALVIAQSGKMEALAELAATELTPDDLKILVANKHRLSEMISLFSSVVDDRKYANSDEGDQGEEIVYNDLLQKYPRRAGYEVIWSSRDFNEPCFDFEIKKGGQTVCYYDAKTTSRGLANSNSIPFFLRKSQWEFLKTLDDIPYYVARVFLGDGGKIKYLQVAYKKD